MYPSSAIGHHSAGRTSGPLPTPPPPTSSAVPTTATSSSTAPPALPTVLFTHGRGELRTLAQGYRSLARRFRSHYRFAQTKEPLTLERLCTVRAVVLSAPSEPFSADEIEALHGYLRQGGRVAVLASDPSPPPSASTSSSTAFPPPLGTASAANAGTGAGLEGVGDSKGASVDHDIAGVANSASEGIHARSHPLSHLHALTHPYGISLVPSLVIRTRYHPSAPLPQEALVDDAAVGGSAAAGGRATQGGSGAGHASAPAAAVAAAAAATAAADRGFARLCRDSPGAPVTAAATAADAGAGTGTRGDGPSTSDSRRGAGGSGPLPHTPLSYIHSFGCPLHITAPAVPLLCSGPLSLPPNCALAAAVRTGDVAPSAATEAGAGAGTRAGRSGGGGGLLVVLGSARAFDDSTLGRADNGAVAAGLLALLTAPEGTITLTGDAAAAAASAATAVASSAGAGKGGVGVRGRVYDLSAPKFSPEYSAFAPTPAGISISHHSEPSTKTAASSKITPIESAIYIPPPNNPALAMLPRPPLDVPSAPPTAPSTAAAALLSSLPAQAWGWGYDPSLPPLVTAAARTLGLPTPLAPLTVPQPEWQLYLPAPAGATHAPLGKQPPGPALELFDLEKEFRTEGEKLAAALHPARAAAAAAATATAAGHTDGGGHASASRAEETVAAKFVTEAGDIVGITDDLAAAHFHARANAQARKQTQAQARAQSRARTQLQGQGHGGVQGPAHRTAGPDVAPSEVLLELLRRLVRHKSMLADDLAAPAASGSASSATTAATATAGAGAETGVGAGAGGSRLREGGQLPDPSLIRAP